MTESTTKLVKRYTLESASSRGVADLLKGVSNLKGELLAAEKGNCPRTIMITSSLDGEGKTTTAIIMARSLTDSSHDKVLLIDASQAKRAFDGWYKIDSKVPSISDVLAGITTLESVAFATDHEQIDIAVYGDSADISTKTFDSGRFTEVLTGLKTKYDFIIVDGPSFLSSSTAALMTKNFDGLIVVVRCKKTKKQIVQKVMDKIELLGGNVIGTVLNYRTYYLPEWLYRWL
jgi:capsular exopolysaccharide synthesis family protein